MPQIHLVDHIIPSFQKWLTPFESLHILTTVLSFLMAAGAWNKVWFPDPGMRCSAMTTGKNHRLRLLHGQLDHGSWWPYGLYHWSGSTPTHHVVFFWSLARAASFPRFLELTFFSTPSNTSSQVSESAWHMPVWPLKLNPTLKLPRHKFSHLPISWVLSHLLNTLLAYCNILVLTVSGIGTRDVLPTEPIPRLSRPTRLFSPHFALVSMFLPSLLVHIWSSCLSNNQNYIQAGLTHPKLVTYCWYMHPHWNIQ